MSQKGTIKSSQCTDSGRASPAVTDTESESTNKVTSRPRARKRQYDDELTVFMTEIKKSIEILKTQQDSLQGSINDVLKQNNDIVKSMEFMSKQYEDMKDRLIKMETEKTHLAYIQTLELKVENLERMQKQTSIEIRNVPVQTRESKEDLLNLVKKVGKFAKIDINNGDIRDVFRLGTRKEENRPIMLDLTSVLLKDKILSSVKSHNKVNPGDKLNTTHIGIEGQPKPIYIVECLTQAARKLYFLAREFSKKNDFSFCWTAHGKVFLRKKEGAPIRRIGCEADLDQLLAQPDK